MKYLLKEVSDQYLADRAREIVYMITVGGSYDMDELQQIVAEAMNRRCK